MRKGLRKTQAWGKKRFGYRYFSFLKDLAARSLLASLVVGAKTCHYLAGRLTIYSHDGHEKRRKKTLPKVKIHMENEMNKPLMV